MTYQVNSVEEYIAALPEDRVEAFLKLREVVRENIPPGFEECFSYGFPAFAVPHSIYPPGYHCKPDEPLPFISIANQKAFIGFYHMGVYALPELSQWFQNKYRSLDIGKLDMGKSCIRLKKMDRIPYALIGELCTRISVEDWIAVYEREYRK